MTVQQANDQAGIKNNGAVRAKMKLDGKRTIYAIAKQREAIKRLGN